MNSLPHQLPSSLETKQILQTFKRVLVDSNDGNQFLMCICLKCEFICRNNTNTKIAHWKRCISRWSFKYVSQNDRTGGFIAVCLGCNMQFYASHILHLKSHYDECSKTANGYIRNQNHAQSKSNMIKRIHENLVSPKEMSAVRKSFMPKCDGVPIPGFLIKYFASEKGLERHSECQSCQQSFKTPKNYTLKNHRKQCLFPRDVLYSTSTQSDPSITSRTNQTVPYHLTPSFQLPSPQLTFPWHSPSPSQTIPLDPIQSMIPYSMSSQQLYDPTLTSTISSGVSQFIPIPVTVPAVHNICFICSTKISQSFVNMYQTESKHSNTKIYEFIWRIMKKQSSSRNNSTDLANSERNVVCFDCLRMINDYDLARTTADKHEKLICDKLSQTEEFYASQQSPVDINYFAPIEPICEIHEEMGFDANHPYEFNQDQQQNDYIQDELIDDDVYYLVELSEEEAMDKENITTITLTDEEDL